MTQKIFRKIASIVLMFASFLMLFSFGVNEDASNTYELIYQTASINDATQIGQTFDLELIEFSSYGFAVYASDDLDRQTEYASHGFNINYESYVTSKFLPILDKDPYYNDQYALQMMEIEEAWTLTEGDPNYLIAIIDTGIDTDHPEFLDRISPLSYNVITDTVGISAVEDSNGHGTGVAGVIGAIKDNSEGVAGIVQQSQLLIIKASENDDPTTTDKDESESFSDSNIIKAINYASEKGADIINLSLGGQGYNPSVQQAVTQAYENGSIIVAASGNDGDNQYMYPASYDNVISVGAVDDLEQIADYSNFNDKVDITAPGSEIVSTSNTGGYAISSGTSLAAPQVTAVIALFQAYYPNFTDDQVISQIELTAKDRGVTGYDVYYGHGIIQAYQAMLLDPITITFETYGGSIIAPIQVPKDEVFSVDEPTKEGYVFEGWYLDSSFSTKFNVGVDTVSTDTTLHANYLIESYTVTFVTDGSSVDPMIVNYNENIDSPLTSLDDYEFVGWYYEADYQTKYEGQPITQDTTLYAKFLKNPYTVSFYIDGLLDHQYELNEGDVVTLYTPEGDDPFVGWFLEPIFETLYEADQITSDLNLYAKFDNNLFVVIYYDSDLTTIYDTQYVSSGMDAVPPASPIKASTPSLNYTFISWSDDGKNITQNTEIFPIYAHEYIEKSIQLEPSIDTIYQDDIWIDQGLVILDEQLTYVLTNEPDTSQVGRYILSYEVYLEEELIVEITRIVNVIAKKVDITFNPGITTIYVGESYEDAGAISNVGSLSVINPVDEEKAGIYQVIYEVEYLGKTYRRIKYVYVLENQVETQSMFIIPKKEEWMI